MDSSQIISVCGGSLLSTEDGYIETLSIGEIVPIEIEDDKKSGKTKKRTPQFITINIGRCKLFMHIKSGFVSLKGALMHTGLCRISVNHYERSKTWLKMPQSVRIITKLLEREQGDSHFNGEDNEYFVHPALLCANPSLGEGMRIWFTSAAVLSSVFSLELKARMKHPTWYENIIPRVTILENRLKILRGSKRLKTIIADVLENFPPPYEIEDENDWISMGKHAAQMISLVTRCQIIVLKYLYENREMLDKTLGENKKDIHEDVEEESDSELPDRKAVKSQPEVSSFIEINPGQMQGFIKNTIGSQEDGWIRGGVYMFDSGNSNGCYIVIHPAGDIQCVEGTRKNPPSIVMDNILLYLPVQYCGFTGNIFTCAFSEARKRREKATAYTKADLQKANNGISNYFGKMVSGIALSMELTNLGFSPTVGVSEEVASSSRSKESVEKKKVTLCVPEEEDFVEEDEEEDEEKEDEEDPNEEEEKK